MFVLLISFVSATEQTLGTFQQDDCVELIQICANCTYNNITSIIYPNSTIAEANISMDKSGSEYRYEYCDTSMLGTYLVYGIGDIDGANTTWGYDFKVTPTGTEPTSAQSSFYLGFLMVVVILLVICIYGLVKSDGLVGKSSFISAIYFLSVGLTFTAYKMADSFVTNTFITELLHIIWQVLMWAFFPFIILVFAYTILTIIKIKEIERLMEKGFTLEEAEKRTKK